MFTIQNISRQAMIEVRYFFAYTKTLLGVARFAVSAKYRIMNVFMTG
jgi:hypothetical protein